MAAEQGVDDVIIEDESDEESHSVKGKGLIVNIAMKPTVIMAVNVLTC